MRLRILAALCALLAAPSLAPALEEEDVQGSKTQPLKPPDTSSPRATFQSFLTYSNAAWRAYLGTRAEGGTDYSEAERYVRRAAWTLDLSELPPVQAQDAGVQGAILLLDVFNRVAIPSPGQVPDADQMEREELTRWVLPDTRITIARVAEGRRAGEWLFTPGTVDGAKDFYLRTRHLPLKPGAVIEDGFDLYISMPGAMIPIAWIEALPQWARAVYFDQTVWQWLALVALLAPALILGAFIARWSRRAPPGQRVPFRRAVAGPIGLAVLVYMVGRFVGEQLGLAGGPHVFLQAVFTMVFYGVAAWAVTLLGGAGATSIIASLHIRPGSIDENIVRLLARIAGFAVGLLILLEGARALGVPVVGVIAGLGVGGLAVALAAQSTIENFIGSLTIFADRPVRVGDFCRFGDAMGTVEAIGLRSTRLRTLDRSILTVPNAEFSRLKLDNLTLRDRILFRATLNLRLETSPDQLRLVLARLRELLVGHPTVHEDPARVRLVAVGPSSVDLEVFAYLMTSDINEFLAMREDLLLRMMDVVEEAGTGFAPPARTSYLATDRGLNEERARGAEAQVEKWRAETALPFPEFSSAQREQLAGRLDYPPAGSAPQPRKPEENED